MVRRLWVDVDDTLVLWSKDKGYANEALVYSIQHYIAELGWQLVIWSGSGVAMASYWADKLFPSIYTLTTEKDETLPDEDDLCVDDMKLKVRARLTTWGEFVTMVESWT